MKVFLVITMENSIHWANESKILVAALMAQRLEHARDLLSAAGLPKSGRREVVEALLLTSVQSGQIPIELVIERLDKIEAWGRQHVFVYQAPERIPMEFRSATALQRKLDNAGFRIQVNTPLSLALPHSKTIRLIRLTKDVLRIEFVEARPWTERINSRDYSEVSENDEVVFQAYRKRLQRAISSFEWNFTDKTAELYIHRLPSGTRYSKQEIAYRELLKPIVDLDIFEPVKMKRALAKLKDAPGVRERKLNYGGLNGSKISLQSPDRATTLGAEPDLKEVTDLIRQSKKFGATFLNGFFEKSEILSEEVHVHIDSFESRVGFLAQCSEASVRYVLSRIRRAAR